MVSEYEIKFQELGPLGGEFSTVFKAKSNVDDRFYAIKKIPFAEIDKERTLKEIDILSKLSSDYTVKYIDHWVENNYYNSENDDNLSLSLTRVLRDPQKTLLLQIQSELCSMSLKDAIKILNDNTPANCMKPENFGLACEILIQLLECIDYLHTLEPQIIHRDLRPENILLISGHNDRFVKLNNFGLSTYHEYVNHSHSVLGRKIYGAPEVAYGKYNTKADIYSLGCIMQEMFNININSDENNIIADLKGKYEVIKSLILKCQNVIAKTRPDCREILDMSDSWAHIIPGEKFIYKIKSIANTEFQALINIDDEDYTLSIQNPDPHSKAVLNCVDRKMVIYKNFDALKNLLDLSKLKPALKQLHKLIDRKMYEQRIDLMNKSLKYITDPEMTKRYILEECIDLNNEKEFQSFIQILLHTANDKLAVKLDPQCIDMWDITRCNPKDGFVTQFSFGLYNKRDTLKHKYPVTTDNCYTMDKKPRGLCYIVNNYFTVGTYIEMQRFRNIFYQLHFKVIIEKNLTANDLTDRLSKLSKRDELNKHNAFVFLSITHGNKNNQIAGFDNMPIDIDDIVDMFSNQNCPQLQNKPKMFFLNCCRGSGKHLGVSRGESLESSPLPYIIKKPLPDNSDFVICYSTLDNYVSYVNWYKGTKFGEIFADILVENVWCDDLNTILIKTNALLLKKAEQLENKQIFEWKSVLTKSIKFLPFTPHEIKLVDKPLKIN